MINSFDALGGITAKHGTTVQNLKTANQISSDLIYAGQAIKVPMSVNSVLVLILAIFIGRLCFFIDRFAKFIGQCGDCHTSKRGG
ncbi:LysM peptidoglycan-binding domain-containing protein [Bacillus sp. DNRA2]|uniref:LysM peptidoglycan-binding domain-containing protein n=1 Tax=Bacillus sp. DNRA2 TaxID=2723053 RepID=UPI00145EBC50|nr:LysM peptidoglycan-binding domain-containing protein [Bacillus sp. DNRA2]NMD70155.1 LysM peptidoglycan-binding domain-containing protein [Bacillus sp. DNRA2]